MPHPFKIAIFDLGRVLVRICDSWRHACEQAGIAAPTGELDSTASAGLLAVVKQSEVGAIDQDAFDRLAAPFLGLAPGQVRAISDAYLLGPYPGGAALLADIRAAGLKTACLSNTNANHWRMMTDPSSPNALPLAHFDHLFASQLIHARKPDAAIYAAAERAAEVAGEQIVFFDDLQENIDAAAARGWHALRILLDADPVKQARDHLRELGILTTGGRMKS